MHNNDNTPKIHQSHLAWLNEVFCENNPVLFEFFDAPQLDVGKYEEDEAHTSQGNDILPHPPVCVVDALLL